MLLPTTNRADGLGPGERQMHSSSHPTKAGGMQAEVGCILESRPISWSELRPGACSEQITTFCFLHVLPPLVHCSVV